MLLNSATKFHQYGIYNLGIVNIQKSQSPQNRSIKNRHHLMYFSDTTLSCYVTVSVAVTRCGSCIFVRPCSVHVQAVSTERLKFLESARKMERKMFNKVL